VSHSGRALSAAALLADRSCLQLLHVLLLSGQAGSPQGQNSFTTTRAKRRQDERPAAEEQGDAAS